MCILTEEDDEVEKEERERKKKEQDRKSVDGQKKKGNQQRGAGKSYNRGQAFKHKFNRARQMGQFDQGGFSGDMGQGVSNVSLYPRKQCFFFSGGIVILMSICLYVCPYCKFTISLKKTDQNFMKLSYHK